MGKKTHEVVDHQTGEVHGPVGIDEALDKVQPKLDNAGHDNTVRPRTR